MTVAHLHSDWHRMSAGLSVRFSLAGACFDAEWQPRMPTKREYSRLIDRYREARGLFLAEMARRRAAAVLCLELPL